MPALATQGEEGAVAAYKAVFKAVLEKRPSGMRLRLADVLGKNRSFISQISNPAYQIADPGAASQHHLPALPFLAGGESGVSRGLWQAHPRRAARLDGVPRERTVTLHLPDLGSAKKRNGQLDALLHEFAGASSRCCTTEK